MLLTSSVKPLLLNPLCCCDVRTFEDLLLLFDKNAGEGSELLLLDLSP